MTEIEIFYGEFIIHKGDHDIAINSIGSTVNNGDVTMPTALTST